MARTVRVGEFQNMQRASKGPKHLGLTEADALGDASISAQDVAARDPLTGQVVDRDAALSQQAGPVETGPEDRAGEQTMAEQLQALGVEAQCTAEMSLHMVTNKVRAATSWAKGGLRPTEAEIVAEAERIWTGFGDQRKGPRVATVDGDGTVRDWRRPETTPDRGPDVGTTVHRVRDWRDVVSERAALLSDDDVAVSATAEEARFSGGGATDDTPEASRLVPSDADFKGKLYLESTELARLASDLIEQHGYLDHLEHCQIRYFWKRKTGSVKRQRVLGGIKRGSDLLGQLLGADFAVFLAADTARERQHTDRRVERSLFRQLRRIGQDDNGNWIELPFTVQLFVEEIQQYADLDDEDLRVGRNAYRAAEQMGLFDDAEDDDVADGMELEDEERAEAQGRPFDDPDYQPPEGEDDRPADPDRPYEDQLEDLPDGDEIDASRAQAGDDPLADHDL